jgi:hypothetical protein
MHSLYSGKSPEALKFPGAKIFPFGFIYIFYLETIHFPLI